MVSPVLSTAPKNITVCVPVKGRLKHLRETLPLILAQKELTCCVTDYQCPDGTAEWLRTNYASECRTRRLILVEAGKPGFFNKCEAANAGARRAIENGADYLLFSDADTKIHAPLGEWLLNNLDTERFSIAALAPDGRDIPDLYGLIGVSAGNFLASGGFDENFVGWGGEDTDFRFRLAARLGLDFQELPVSMLGFIKHSPRLRTQFYEESRWHKSNAANGQLLRRHIQEWTGLEVTQLKRRLRRLWFQNRSRHTLSRETSVENKSARRPQYSRSSFRVRCAWGNSD